MKENLDSVWERIAGKLHNELSAEEEIEFNGMMSESELCQKF